MKLINLIYAALMLTPLSSNALEFNNEIGFEAQLFNHQSTPSTYQSNLAMSIQPSWLHQNEQGNLYYTFTPFLRWDEHDDMRTHADIRELKVLRVWDKWEAEAGLVKVFWGVAEANHLVDIINQTDYLEGLDGEDKLGQPMLRLSRIFDQSTLSMYLLPGFREREYAGLSSRFALPFSVDTNSATFETSDEEQHHDFALRLSGYKGQMDYGLSWFKGTTRDAQLLPQSPTSNIFVPHYEQIERVGLDVQLTKDAWLLKLEAIHQQSLSGDYSAYVTGVEYSFYGLHDGTFDLGIIAEYNHDSRDQAQTVLLQDDVFIGARLAFNDAESSSLLAGVISDLGDDSRSLRVEASRRVLDNATLDIEAQVFSNISNQNVLFGARDNDFVKLDFTLFF